MNNKELVVLIGLPASGKSTWVAENCPNHVIVSNDAVVEKYGAKLNLDYNEAWKKVSFKTVKYECNNTFKKAVSDKKSIVIDNTNMTPKARRTYRAEGYYVKAVVFDIPEEEWKRRTEKRKNETGKLVPDAAIMQMRKAYRPPAKEEGFDEIIYVKQ